MNEKYSLNKAFLDALSGLNEHQKEAVNHIEGPVLVLAGPGTGKTQILSARIGNILQQTDAQPGNILCLTYTDAGTIAMRERLAQFIGPEAYNVHIHTFHSFCNKVIQENTDKFGHSDLQPISDLEAVDLYHELIDAFDKDHLLKDFKNPYNIKNRLENLFGTMKQENWSAEFIEEKCNEYLEGLKDNEDFYYKRKTGNFKKGDFKIHKFEEQKEKLDKLITAAKELTNYQDLLTKYKRYDYNDMIQWVLKAFQEDELLLAQYQEQYLYFLVDEYQDTNGSQNLILKQLYSFWEIPNVFVVGDDDQSIYRFQGANVANIEHFWKNNEPHLTPVVLTDNYRSSQKILDASKQLIEHNSERLINHHEGLSKNLSAKGKYAESEVQPEIWSFQNSYQEEVGVVQYIEEKLKETGDISNMAVLYRNHRDIENLVKVCQNRDIPVNIRRKENILHEPVIINLLKILEYLYLENKQPHSAEYLLFEIMHIDLFDISPRDVALISRDCSHYDPEKRKAWRQVISSPEYLFQLSLGNPKAITEFEKNLSSWLKDYQNCTIQVLFEKIVSRSGLLKFVMDSPDRNFLMQAVTKIFDFIKDESAKSHDFDVKRLLDIVDKMNRHNIALPAYKVIQNEKGIHFITAHSSKGLQFKEVLIFGCVEKSWEKKSGNNFNFKMPDTIIESNAGDESEEERRLFYVAATRAEEKLVITYSNENKDGKTQSKSRFVEEIAENDLAVILPKQIEEETTLTYLGELLSIKSLPSLPLVDNDLITQSLKNFRMSVTSLNKYLKCPISFYFETIIRVPQARNAGMGFGSAVHHALEFFFKEMTASESKTFPPEARLVALFKEGLDKYRSHFTQKEYDNRVEYGEKILPAYYNHYVKSWNKVTVLEYDIRHATVGDVPITGKLDKLEFDGTNVNVVDYKTGKPENVKKYFKLVTPGEKDPLGGDYWRQIVFYKLLMDADHRKEWKMISGEMDLIEPNKKDEYEKYKIIVTPEDQVIVRDQIKMAWDRIQKHEFQDGCGDENCQWCNFVKTNYREAPELGELEIEEEL